jgi:hypothetical protein
MTEILAFQGLLVVCATMAFIASLQFVRRMVELRHQRSFRPPVDHLQDRLDRIESIVESTAVEVERVAEANRFMAKLLAERTAETSRSGHPERVITPH